MKLYTIQEIADMLKVHHMTVRRWIRENQLQAVKIGNGWRISEESLNKFLGKA